MIDRLIGKMNAAILVASFLGAGSVGYACDAINFKTMALPAASTPPALRALIAAYPGLGYRADDQTVIMPDGTGLPFGLIRNVEDDVRLKSATIAEQFLYPYPLVFDLAQRRVPWVDPGRLRNDAFFRALYFDAKGPAKKSLQKVSYRQGVRADFYMTGKHQVACQLSAVFAELAAIDQDFTRYFRKIGGSFNWRTISGTTRLSAHSFGMALDLNTELGQYWKWTGAKPGEAYDYNNIYPAAMVEVFETYGFIWGGKWHHFDGMHFEYRPELVLYARITG